MNPEQARSSIVAQQCGGRWAAICTGDRAPCLYDDRAHQHAQANIDIGKNKTTATTMATTNSTQQRSSRTAPRPPSSQRPTQLQQAARCGWTPQKARSSILAQPCWRRWEASRTRDRAPCLLDDRAHQHAQANKQQNNNSSNNNDNDRHTQQHSITVHRPPSFQRPTQLARGKRSNKGYQPRPARRAAVVLVS